MKSGDDRIFTVFKETHLRSLVKAVVYRIVSLTGTAILSWAITRDIAETFTITVAIQLFLMVLYYSSERVWNRITWGRIVDTT